MTFDDLRAAINLPDFDPIPAWSRMAPLPRAIMPENIPDSPRQAGVLVLLFPKNGDFHIVLTRRTERLRGHSGQISFPGGKRDPEDPSFEATALRETCEELGLCNNAITVIGTMNSIYIPPSHFQVYPTVATMTTSPDFTPNPDEVAEVFTLAVQDLLDDTIKQEEDRLIQGHRIKIPHYLVNKHKIWGATAIMLSELEHRLRAVS